MDSPRGGLGGQRAQDSILPLIPLASAESGRQQDSLVNFAYFHKGQKDYLQGVPKLAFVLDRQQFRLQKEEVFLNTVFVQTGAGGAGNIDQLANNYTYQLFAAMSHLESNHRVASVLFFHLPSLLRYIFLNS
ncbi:MULTISPECIES: hypothetical protein [unclassified Pseudomonas]|uniref:hypothetical protein n=1 Tax=unclassified Pseudomonas TaxID=196821 RepID=UPI002AC91B12|nr:MULTISPECIES: hypothetical protein [unclassified Pseudomonas]MEB0043072.1 hypothetical protein [Pseudomonas sp. MH10]MEB0121463.1 hypothetical protein [Pseudomonas sp. CCI1.2]WPX64070.1 hypothetical protein RHM59_25015 [Pseudomonas sp. MH10]